MAFTAYPISDVCSPDPKLPKCVHFLESSERYTLLSEFKPWIGDTRKYEQKYSHACKDCLPTGVKIEP